jgi:hypothetical protein
VRRRKKEEEGWRGKKDGERDREICVVKLPSSLIKIVLA